MFHRGCDLFKTVGDEDTVQRILNLIGGCEAKHWLKSVIVMPVQLNWAGA